MPSIVPSTGLTITNPLVLYRALLATKRIEPDEAQHRLAIHLQKLYHRLKDYEPTLDYAHRLEQISSTISRPRHKPEPGQDGAKTQSSFLASMREKKLAADSLALTRSMTSAEAAMHMESPKGLLLHGEVGTGKSMLVDLLATSLPNKKKKRWHFNSFMLETFSRLERLRKQRSRSISDGAMSNAQSSSLLLVARDLVETSPIIFLDEFQLPDRASAKILSNLFTVFFQLGGVLVATSNRMPEELAKASGIEFTPPPQTGFGLGSLRSLVKSLAGDGRDGASIGKSMFSSNSDFAQFLDVLKARCETWDMAGDRDWRRRDSESMLAPETVGGVSDEASTMTTSQPPNYHLMDDQSDDDWFTSVESALGDGSRSISPITWTPKTLHIYSRPLILSQTRDGIAKCSFEELCATNLGPADYISIASAFHTLIITNVPVLSLLQKNEARRFITLLDALYEAHCRLLLRAEAGPDDLFFPEISKSADHSKSGALSEEDQIAKNESDQAIYAESFSDMYQDMTSPFRPNISSYTSPASEPSYATSPLPSNPSHKTTPTTQTSPKPSTRGDSHASARSILADEDADFGPVYGAGRSSGASTGHDTGASFSDERDISSRAPNFQYTSQFTGADERFAFARARSRLWEMCGRRWWEDRPLDRVQEWWHPMDREGRGWEGERGVATESPTVGESGSSEDLIGLQTEELRRLQSDDQGEFPHGATSPFRSYPKPPPKIGWMHAWGMVKWGRKAGAWGQGPEALGDRVKGKGIQQGEEKGKGS